jgi:hypothetical protein
MSFMSTLLVELNNLLLLLLVLELHLNKICDGRSRNEITNIILLV